MSGPVGSGNRDPTADGAAVRLLGRSPGALCTIVSIDGSFSRDAGAQLAICEDGTMAGSLSDHCLEEELATQAKLARRDGKPIALRYGAGAPTIDFRLPCGAGLDIIVDPWPDRREITRACNELDQRRPTVLRIASAGRFQTMLRSYAPALQLLLFGSGPEVAALEALCAAIGVAVSSRAPGAGIALGQPPCGAAADEWTAVVLLFHDHEWEEEILAWALGTTAFYIGCIGGPAARSARARRLAARGFDAPSRARVRGPVGLIESARDPATLALSILAEVVADYERLRHAEPLLSPEFPLLEAAE